MHFTKHTTPTKYSFTQLLVRACVENLNFPIGYSGTHNRLFIPDTVKNFFLNAVLLAEGKKDDDEEEEDAHMLISRENDQNVDEEIKR